MGIVLRVFFDNMYHDLEISELKKVTVGSGIRNTYTINSSSLKKRHIYIRKKKDKWIVKRRGVVLLDSEAIKKVELAPNQTFVLNKEDKIAITVIETKEVRSERIVLDSVTEITIGRDYRNNIVLSNKKVSNNHAKIYKSGAEYHVADIGSTNGTYVNNILIHDVVLKENDIIGLCNYTLIYSGKEITFKNVGNDILVHNIKKKERDLKQIPLFKRSPRLKLDLPNGEIEIQAAPNIGGKPEINWLSTLLPSLGMITVMAVVGMLTHVISSLYYTIPMGAIGVITAISSYRAQKKKYDRQQAMRKKKYTEYISGVTENIESKANEQLKAMTLSDPDTCVCFDIARDIERRLWERKPTDTDFASYRIGGGQCAFCMKINIPNETLSIETDEFVAIPKKIKNKYENVKGIPVKYDSVKNPSCGIVGERRSALNLIKNIIVQAATQHSYEDFKIVTVFDREEAKDFEWIRWLPHSFDNSKDVRYMADTQDRADVLFKNFEELFVQRERDLDEKGAYKINGIKLPFYLFVIGDCRFVDGRPIMKYLTSNNSVMGVAAIFMFDDLGRLPASCSTTIEVKDGKGSIYSNGNIGEKIFFDIDDTTELDFEEFSRNLAPIKVPISDSSSNLPTCITFLEGYGVKSPDEIPVKKYWEEALTYKSLAVPIGVKTNGDTFGFDIHEKKHGPHGLVAGTTGSGKSEMVQSWILSMAIHFSPMDVSFVLIDFKGTGLILPFMNLPHLAGTISDLDKNIKRNLIALENELQRRKNMLDGAGVNNINAYLKLYKSKKVSEPMPYLFIVIDEYAEFKSQFPEFGSTIDSILRTGRTLGVFSILLMQKPAGVVSDQSESNVKFRWCLKVAAPTDSREMLATGDAAQISNPGRAYVKVSNKGAQDYVYELVQSYWSGAPYNPNRKEKATIKPKISVVDIVGNRISYDVEEKTMGFKSDVNEIDVIVKYLQNVATDCGNLEARPIWNPKLASNIYLEDITEPIFDGDKWQESKITNCLAPIVGMVDDPRNQTQYPLKVSLSEDGHTVIYGAPGTGKTTFLQTMILSICKCYRPDEVSIYVMDFGGWNMGLFRRFPHVGGVANDNENEKIHKLIRLLSKELEQRKLRFAGEGVGNIIAYRDATGEKIPFIVLIVDNFTPVFNLYPEFEDFFITYTREGGNYGLYLVTVTNNVMGMGYKISQNIKNAIALQMTDKSDYSQIVGRNYGLEPEKTPGRGLVKSVSPLEFQTALPIKGSGDGDRANKIKALADRMDTAWSGNKAKVIPIMPELIAFGSVKGAGVVLGLSSQDVEPVEISFDSSHYILISGKSQSGKSNLIKVIGKQLGASKIIVYDPNVALKTFDTGNNNYFTDAKDFDMCIERLIPELENRRKEYQAGTNKEFERIAILIDDIKHCFDSASNDTINRLFAITKIGKNLNVILVAAGMNDEIAKLSSQGERLTCNMISGQHTVILGGSASDHDLFKIGNLSFAEKVASVDEYEGYLIVKEKAVRFKTMYEK